MQPRRWIAKGCAPTAFAAVVFLAPEIARAEEASARELPQAPAPASMPSWTRDLRFSGYLQADWGIVRQSSLDEVNSATGDPLNEKRFLIRRGHLRADYDGDGPVFGSLELDANTIKGTTVRLVDAEASFRWPQAKDALPPSFVTTLGLFKTPFGFEVLEADNVRPFLERATVIRALFPGEFDLGLRFKLKWRALNLAMGLMNGAPLGEKQLPGRDPNESKDLVGRLGATTTPVEGVGVDFGLSGVTGSGFHKGTPSTKDQLVWRDTNEDGVVQPTEIQVIPGSSSTASQNFKRFGLGADVQVRVAVPVLGELALRGELVFAKNLDRGIMPADPVATGRDLREVGWYAGATQEVTRWGMVGVRYDRYDADADASRQAGASILPSSAVFSTVAVMGMLRWSPGRLILEYDHNTNPLGRDAAGAPTTLKDDALTLRGEVTF